MSPPSQREGSLPWNEVNVTRQGLNALSCLRRYRIGSCLQCRVSPRRASYFHLLAQMKVTKAKGANRIWPERFGYAPRGPLATTRDDDNRSALDGSLLRTAPILHEPFPTRVALQEDEARACAPPVERSEARWTPVVARGPLGRGADGNGEDEWFCIQPLCFGYFHLVKVTRPPGETRQRRHEPIR